MHIDSKIELLAPLRFRFIASCIVVFVLAGLASDARAQVTGSDGAAGVRGTDGVDGGDGGDGTAGGDGIRQSSVTNGPNSIEAKGGAGGDGGAGGAPNGTGGRGGAGGNAIATGVTRNAEVVGLTTIDATGGRGGNGGRPGDVVAGRGGSGGDGGRAEVRADVTGYWVRAHAIGGAGGNGIGANATSGAGGDATAEFAPITDWLQSIVTLEGGAGGTGQLGAAGGNGGRAGLSSPRSGASSWVASSGLVHATESISAIAGVGGSSAVGAAGRGGDASLSVDRIVGTGGSLSVELDAVGGRGGNARSAGVPGAGGNADARARVEIGGEATVIAKATGGAGGLLTSAGAGGPFRDGAAGGVATGSAVAISTLDRGLASATLRLFGGNGGTGARLGQRGADGATGIGTAEARTGASGTARATVEVHGGVGGAGFVEADAGHGGDAILFNAVSGVGGRVELFQSAFGGTGGISNKPAADLQGGGRGGDAVSIVDQANPDGSLSIESHAAAGAGGADGGLAGHATAGGSGVALTGVKVVAKSTGGTAGLPRDHDVAGADGGEASLAPIRGRANNVVDLTGWIQGGAGGSGARVSGRGANARVVDAVEATTDGVFRATQIAVAGNAGATLQPGQANSGAQGGDATNQLDLDENVRQLSTNLIGLGGRSTGRDGNLVGRKGGSADLELTTTNHAGNAEATYGASGGAGSEAGGAGGDARSFVRLTTDGDDHDILVRGASSYFDGFGYLGGSFGGAGGDAMAGAPGSGPGGIVAGSGGEGRAEVEGWAHGNSRVDVEALSRGGAGGENRLGGASGDGGRARSVARGGNAGSSEVLVSALAVGGSGGRWFSIDPPSDALLGDGGSAEAEAWGESSGGADVTVRASAGGGGAWEGRGGSARLVDAVAGRTSGRLVLQQYAGGGGSLIGVGGDAESSLTHIDENASALELVVDAIAGTGGAGGGHALAAARGIGQGEVTIDATASLKRDVYPVTPLGTARLGPVYGESLGGGAVQVRGAIYNGPGRAVVADSRDASADVPLDVVLDGVVDGRTTGTLRLEQVASGGSAVADALPAAMGAGRVVRAGSVLNRLVRTLSTSGLEIMLASGGGAGANGSDRVLAPIEGGRASNFARILNDGGSVLFQGSTVGGAGGIGIESARGGDALLDVEIETHGDGADIVINPSSSAVRGGDSHEYNRESGGKGGDAISRSIGRAVGDSAVEIFDHAVGGIGIRSGSASSFASGANAGSRRVHVTSSAETGRIFDVVSPQDRGTAFSQAHGSSPSGEVEVEANASSIEGLGGAFPTPAQWTGGLASARAIGEGRSTHVRAESSGLAGAVGEQSVLTRVSTHASGSGSLEARAVSGSETPPAQEAPGVEVSAALGAIHTRTGEWSRGELDMRADRSDLDIVLGGEFEFFDHDYEPTPSALFVSFLAIELDDDDFTSLALRITEGDRELLSRTFGDAASARAFFAAPLSIAALTAVLPAPDPSERGLVIAIEGTGVSTGTDFHLALAVGRSIVPEPGVATLLLVGFLILDSQRTRAGSRR